MKDILIKDILILGVTIITGSVLVALLMIIVLYNAQHSPAQHSLDAVIGPDDIARMAGSGNHCIESIEGGGWQLVDGNCFNVDSNGDVEFLNQAHEECTGTETWFCSFHGLRRMPMQEETEKK